MKPLLILACCCVLLPLAARGHVGSPNVFFEGKAGPYPLRVIIRPPAALPGIAHVDVRVTGEAVTNVSVQAALWEAGVEAAPVPVLAMAVAGETNLFNTPLWLLRGGSYHVRVAVEGWRGHGTAVVPLNAAASQRPAMSRSLVTTLVALGIFLVAAIVWLAGATARDSTLEPGATPTVREHLRARSVMLGVIVLLTGGTYACGVRWQTMDREFRNRVLYKPLPVVATVRTNGTLRLLHLTPTPDNSGAARWDTLVADHGKLMHVFLLRDPDFNAFAHLHPVRRDARTFENVLPPLPAGSYRLYVEITHESGLSQTLTANVSLPATVGSAAQSMRSSNMLNEVFCLPVAAPAGNAPQPFTLDADDSWHASPAPNARPSSGIPISKMMDGHNMVFRNTSDLIENRETSLRFALFTPEGQPAKLQPYMGMLGHAIVRRSDGEVFTHLHPIGNISMAAQELLLQREVGENRLAGDLSQINSAMRLPATPIDSAANEVAFPYAFPRGGDYRLWVQVRTSGRVLTGVFDLPVKPAP